jgi:hypothetical protein
VTSRDRNRSALLGSIPDRRDYEMNAIAESAPHEPDWTEVWKAVADEINTICQRGLAHVVTEDVLRHLTVLELQRGGVDGSRLRIEQRAPVLQGSLDLVIDVPPTAVVEFKFPRDVAGRPDTMAVGALLEDLCRLSMLNVADVFAAQLIGPRILGNLMRRNDVTWALSPGAVMGLDDLRVALLPETARRNLHSWREGNHVTARCEGVFPAGEWSIFLYRVLPEVGGEAGSPAAIAQPPSAPPDAEHRFHRAMVEIYERARREAGYTATRFLQMVSEQGGLASARTLLHTPAVSEGFTALWERGRLDLTVEARVLEPEFESLFSEEERRIARERLRQYGHEGR